MSNATRPKILKAAKSLFLEKGYDGVRMQELADKAGINKGLLHYHFKSKANIFHAIFSVVVENLMAGVVHIMQDDMSYEQKIDKIVDAYLETLQSNPGLPAFIFFAINRHPELLEMTFNKEKAQLIIQGVGNELAKNGQASDPLHAVNTFLNIISLNVFPFMARPIVTAILGDNSNEFDTLIEIRKPMIKKLLVAQLNLQL